MAALLERSGPMTRLLMVMPYRQLIRKAREEGFWVCSVWDARLESAEYLREAEALSDAFHLADFRDHAALKRLLRELAVAHDVSLVHHLGREDSMEPVYQAAEELGMALNPSSAVRMLNDKLAMRRRLWSLGVSPVRFATAAGRRDVPR